MAQRPEYAAVGIAEGERADAAEPVAQQDAQHGAALLPDGGGHRQLQLLRAAPDLQGDLLPALLQRRDQRGRVRHAPPAGPADEIAGLQPRVLRGMHCPIPGLHRAEARHDHPVGADLDAHRLPAHQQLLRVCGGRQAEQQKKGRKSRENTFFHKGCLLRFFHTNQYVRRRTK